jgi:hypothetical protein
MTVTDVYSPSETALVDAMVGDTLELSQYVQEVSILERRLTIYGLVVIVQSTHPAASAKYRLRATHGDDRLLLEKQDGDDWTSHCRVEATKTN